VQAAHKESPKENDKNWKEMEGVSQCTQFSERYENSF